MSRIIDFLIIFIILLFASCENNKSQNSGNSQIFKESVVKYDTIRLRPESPEIINLINSSDLNRFTYEHAIMICGKPFGEWHFVLNEKPLTSLRKFLVRNFTKAELNLPITIKEAKWDNGKDDYIVVFYQVKDSLWHPIQATQFRKTMPLDDSNFENIIPKEE